MASEAVQYYHDLLAGEYLASTHEILSKASETQPLSVAGRPVCNVLRPYFIDETTYEFTRLASTQVMRAISQLSHHLMADPVLRKELDLTPDEEAVIQIETGYGAHDVSARLDGFLGPAGELNFIEYNADSPGGLAFGEVLGNVFSSMPILEAFAKRYPYRLLPIRSFMFETLLDVYHRWKGKGLPNIAIIDWRGVSTYNEFLLMQEQFEIRGCRVRIADPDELEYRHGILYIQDFPVDLVYKRLVVGELLAKIGLNHPLVEAVRDRAVCMANGFQIQMLYKKLIFLFLSDPEYAPLFEPAVTQALARHIPWTRKVRECKTTYQNQTIDLVPFIADNRERLVLKPNGSYGGRGVVLGWECDNSQWKEELRNALSSSYVVQERVPVGKESYPSLIDGKLHFEERYFDLDPYVWNGERVEGCGVRLSKAALLNVAGGGSATPMFILR